MTTLMRAPMAARFGLRARSASGSTSVPLPGVLEEDVVIPIAEGRAPHLDEEIDVAVAIPVGTGNTMTLLEVSRARAGRDLGESLAARRS